MKDYILLLPLIYLFHDFEEIIGFGWFFRRNPEIFTKYPRLTAAYREYTDVGMAVGVFEQFLLFFGGSSVLAFYFPSRALYGVWYAMLLGLTAHFAVHIGICIYIRRYVPSLITSLICLPVGVLLLIKTAGLMTFDMLTVVSAAVTIPAMMLNMKLAHIGMFMIGKKLSG